VTLVCIWWSSLFLHGLTRALSHRVSGPLTHHSFSGGVRDSDEAYGRAQPMLPSLSAKGREFPGCHIGLSGVFSFYIPNRGLSQPGAHACATPVHPCLPPQSTSYPSPIVMGPSREVLSATSLGPSSTQHLLFLLPQVGRGSCSSK
jgi:hypothetical protein